MDLEFDLVVGGVPRFPAEASWAWRNVARAAGRLAARTATRIPHRRPVASDAAGDSAIVLVVADPEAYLLPAAALRLVRAIEGGADLAIPVSNEPWSEEARRPPPFPYHTPSLLEEAVEAVAAGETRLVPTEGTRSPVFAVRRELLLRLPGSLPLDEVPVEAARARSSVVIDPGAYVHRYGEMDGQARGDLVVRIPPDARTALDVGCSKGATGPLLRRAGVARIVGIEPDAAVAAHAAGIYDRVLAMRLEDVAEEFPGEFDAILFGDVLEHLVDPCSALLRVRPWLSPRGAVVASLPNSGHWSVVADLVEGRFDYVPYSILSGTHLRLFTRRTIQDLFEASGYGIDSIETVTFPPSPRGALALERLRRIPGASGDLAAAEFLVVARPARPYDRRDDRGRTPVTS